VDVGEAHIRTAAVPGSQASRRQNAMFDYSVTMIRAELEWVTQFMSQPKSQTGW